MQMIIVAKNGMVSRFSFRVILNPKRETRNAERGTRNIKQYP